LDLAERGRHPTLDEAADATFAVLTSALERGQAAGEVRRGSVPDQAVASWSLVHGLTTLLIDRRLTFLGLSTAEAERHARLACAALIEGCAPRRPDPRVPASWRLPRRREELKRQIQAWSWHVMGGLRFWKWKG
jgi:hypothetical protein